jgi:hypothetical protein
MKLLVTGGNGGIGRTLVSTLIHAGHSVRVFDRSAAPQPHAAVEHITGDLADNAALHAAVDGVDAVIHLAALTYPAAAPAQQIIAVNVAGTFNVYAAAAEAGVKRVVSASSINALGYNFGVRDFAIRYFPIDEAHAAYTTDAYSFSKQTVEAIGDYFWRRDGISGAQLRLPWVYNADVSLREGMAPYVGDFEETRAAFLACADQEQRRIATSVLALRERIRRERLTESPDGEFWLSNGDTPANRLVTFLMFGHTDFWSVISSADAAQALSQAAVADYGGSHAVFVGESENALGVSSRLLVGLFFPDAELRGRFAACETLVSYERATALFGFAPTTTMRRELSAHEPT